MLRRSAILVMLRREIIHRQLPIIQTHPGCVKPTQGVLNPPRVLNPPAVQTQLRSKPSYGSNPARVVDVSPRQSLTPTRPYSNQTGRSAGVARRTAHHATDTWPARCLIDIACVCASVARERKAGKDVCNNFVDSVLSASAEAVSESPDAELQRNLSFRRNGDGCALTSHPYTPPPLTPARHLSSLRANLDAMRTANLDAMRTANLDAMLTNCSPHAHRPQAHPAGGRCCAGLSRRC